MARILLVKPPLSPHAEVENVLEPLELLSLAGALAEHEPYLLDLRIERGRLAARVSELKPDIIGFSCLIMDVPEVLSMAQLCRSLAPRSIIIVGGPHPTHCPEDLASPCIDLLAQGLGEFTLRELAERVDHQKPWTDLPGTITVDQGQLRSPIPRPMPSTLDLLPAPCRNVAGYDSRRYRLFGLHKMQSINTSRGCSSRCTFCLVWKDMRGCYVTKSAERILAELQALDADTKVVGFIDPHTFLDGPERLRKLRGLIEKAGLPRRRYVMSLRASSIVEHQEEVAAWGALGLSAVSVGLEAIDDRQLSALRKGTSAEDNVRCLEILARAGIHAIANFIIPQEFLAADFAALQRFVWDHHLQLARFSILTPLPGTVLYEASKDRLLSKNHLHYDLLHSVLPTVLPRREFYERVFRLFLDTHSFKTLWSVLWHNLLAAVGRRSYRVPRMINPLMILITKYKLRSIRRHHEGLRESMPS